MNLKNKRIFISGGAGVIGCELVNILNNYGAKLLVGDIKRRPISFPSNVQYRRGDLNYIETYEIKTSSSVYIFSNDMNYCQAYTDNYTTVPTSSNTLGTVACATAAAAVTEIRPITKLNKMTDITGGYDMSKIIGLISGLTTNSTFLDAEFEAMGLSSTNTIRKTLSDQLAVIDNGGLTSTGDNCSEFDTTKTIPEQSTAYLFGLVAGLIYDAADNSTSYDATALKEKNKLDLSTLALRLQHHHQQLPHYQN